MTRLNNINLANQLSFTHKEKQQKSSAKATAIGIVASAGTGLVTATATTMPLIPLGKGFKNNLSSSMNYKQGFHIAEEMDKLPQLQKSGFNLILFNNNSARSIDKANDITLEILKNYKKQKPILAKGFNILENIKLITAGISGTLRGNLNEFLISLIYKTKSPVELGQLAGPYYQPIGNFSLIEKNFIAAAPHELGHALNANGNFLTKLPRRVKEFMPMVSLSLFLVSLLHNKKTPSEKSENSKKNNIEKTKDFIKDHLFALTALTYVPKLIEEARASINGIKFVKNMNYLKAEQLIHLKKAYTFAFATYALECLSEAVTSKLVVAVKDKVTAHFSKHNNI